MKSGRPSQDSPQGRSESAQTPTSVWSPVGTAIPKLRSTTAAAPPPPTAAGASPSRELAASALEPPEGGITPAEVLARAPRHPIPLAESPHWVFERLAIGLGVNREVVDALLARARETSMIAARLLAGALQMYDSDGPKAARKRLARDLAALRAISRADAARWSPPGVDCGTPADIPADQRFKWIVDAQRAAEGWWERASEEAALPSDVHVAVERQAPTASSEGGVDAVIAEAVQEIGSSDAAPLAGSSGSETDGAAVACRGVAQVPIAWIRREASLQSRHELRPRTAREYTEAMIAGAVFPPVVVFFDGQYYWLADGFHTTAAAEQAGLTVVLAEIKAGTWRHALLHAAGANQTHGLRRTNKDKRRAVMMLLGDDEFSAWSDREIARHVGVTHPFVAKVRHQLGGNGYHLQAGDTGGGGDGAKDSREEAAGGAGSTEDEEAQTDSNTLPPILDADDMDLLRQGLGHVTQAHEALASLVLGWDTEPGPDVDGVRPHVHDLVHRLAAIRELLEQDVIPAEVCPSCPGPGCKTCGGAGWLSRRQVDSLRPAAEAQPPTANKTVRVRPRKKTTAKKSTKGKVKAAGKTRPKSRTPSRRAKSNRTSPPPKKSRAPARAGGTNSTVSGESASASRRPRR